MKTILRNRDDAGTAAAVSRWAGLALASLLAGCAVGGAQFSPLAVDPDKAVIYVYTLDDEYVAQRPAIAVDDREAGKLDRGHLIIPVAPGRHSVTVTASMLMIVPVKREPLEMNVEAGQSLYLRLDGFRGYTLTRIPPDDARDEIKTTRASTG